MIPAAFDYARASSVEEAVGLLGGDEDAKLLAGGHSLLPLLRLRFARPSLLVDIGRIDGLRYIREDGDRIAIGALTPYVDVVGDALLAQKCAVIPEAVEGIGDPQVRNRGTVGGAVAHGDPASDLAAVLLAIDADFVAHGPDGERTIPATEFFKGPFVTALERADVLTEVRVPAVARGAYVKHVRSARDWATVGVAAADVDGSVQVALASMGAVPLRAGGVEQALADGASSAEAAQRAAEGTDPPSDISGSSEYRAHLAKVLVRRALDEL